jgi:hypothetical protein
MNTERQPPKEKRIIMAEHRKSESKTKHTAKGGSKSGHHLKSAMEHHRSAAKHHNAAAAAHEHAHEALKKAHGTGAAKAKKAAPKKKTEGKGAY